MKHVWSPCLGVWAQVQEQPSVAASTFQTSDSAMAASCSHGDCSSTETPCKRSSRQCHGVPRSSSAGGNHGHDSSFRKVSGSYRHRHHRVNVRAPHKKASDELLHQHDWHEGSYNQDEHHVHDQCAEPHHTCPICLSPISLSSLTVLRWCMHRFCFMCIKKWSSLQRFCPICKQIFNGWYYNIKSPSVFGTKDLADEMFVPRKQRYTVSRRSTSLSVRRSQPLPWRRDFRLSRRVTSARFEKVSESKADDAALRWRASVYKKNLRAVPSHLTSRVKIKQAPVNDPEGKARIERRLEPWIRRELQAIMEDTDPLLLVHFVLSLWLHALSERDKIADSRNTQHQHDRVRRTGIWDSEAIRQLEPFLQEKACMFWHELSCFAESPFSLQTHDCVTKYEKLRG